MLNFVAFGHSHVVALARGAYALQEAGATFQGEPVACAFNYLYDPAFEPPFVEGQPGVLNPAFAAALEQHAPRFLITSVGGNEHNALAMVRSDPPFDFILGESPDLPLDRAAEILPEAAVRETIRDWMEDKIAVLRALRAATSVPIAQIEPPPPLPREQVLAYPKEFFRSALNLRKMSPDVLRMKMWRLQTGLYREICARLGVTCVPTRPDLIGPDGMLARHAWGQDATHANTAYGEAMVGEALRLLFGVTRDAPAPVPATGEA